METIRWLQRSTQRLTFTQWNVGLVDEPIASLLAPSHRPKVKWYENGNSTMVADPFGLYENGRLHVIAEEKPLSGGAAWISVLEGWQSEEERTTTPILQAHHHLSYPFLFEFEGDRYMVPEAARSGKVELYRAIEFPWKWERDALLLGEPLLDPTIFWFGGRWWMLGARNDFELHGWFSDTPKGPWIRHHANPLKVDRKSSRPAGSPFIHMGYLYRPAQDQSRTYGGGISLNRIERLDDAGLLEVTVRTVEPDRSWPFRDGTHHLCDLNGSYLIDAKRVSIRPRVLAGRVYRRILRRSHRTRSSEK